MEITNFISPKQLLEIKSEMVEQALVQANPIIALEFKDGIFLVAENPSGTLNKITELYDRMVFAGTGVYNDYEKLRKHGVQFADISGFTYSRKDVHAKSVATEYSTILGDIFTHQQVPLEVEILVAELGETQATNRLYRILYSGGLIEEEKICVIGDIHRDPETRKLAKNTIGNFLRERNLDGSQDLKASFRTAVEALARIRKQGAPLRAEHLEAVVLDSTEKKQRKMRRLKPETFLEWVKEKE